MHYQYKNSRGQVYFLHTKVVELRGGHRMQAIYFFAKDQRLGGMSVVPAGFEVVENSKTGLPVLRRIK